jgi:acetyl esterase/lipase
MNAYILRYTTKEDAANYAPLIQAALAIKLVRERAEEDNTDPTQVYIVGFSAGGHLAASAGIYWNIPEVRDAVGVSSGDAPEGINRPDGMVLCYPVIISDDDYTHLGTRNAFCGTDTPTDEEKACFSLDLHVDDTTPPAFIWHTFTDAAVPVENSLRFMNAMAAKERPFEAHIYPHGVHGLSLCNEEVSEGREDRLEPHAAGWIDLAIKWINFDKKA